MAAGAAALLAAASPSGSRAASLSGGDWRVRRGVNLSHWFWMPLDAARSHAPAPEELQRLRDEGYDFVRLPVDPDDPWVLDGHSLPAAAEAVAAAGLRLLVDLHPAPAILPSLLESPRAIAGWAAAGWETLLPQLRHLPAGFLALQVLNEPPLTDERAWQEIQGGLLARLRAALPEHRLVAGGAAWSSVHHLARLRPYADEGLLYAFHFYKPNVFTHQGAGWGEPGWRHLSGIPYPVTAAELRRRAAAADDPAAAALLRGHADGDWNAERLAAEVGVAVAWARQHGRPLICTEFGAYAGSGSDPVARLRYLRDLTGIFEREGIAHCRWDFRGGFAG